MNPKGRILYPPNHHESPRDPPADSSSCRTPSTASPAKESTDENLRDLGQNKDNSVTGGAFSLTAVSTVAYVADVDITVDRASSSDHAPPPAVGIGRPLHPGVDETAARGVAVADPEADRHAGRHTRGEVMRAGVAHAGGGCEGGGAVPQRDVAAGGGGHGGTGGEGERAVGAAVALADEEVDLAGPARLGRARVELDGADVPAGGVPLLSRSSLGTSGHLSPKTGLAVSGAGGTLTVQVGTGSSVVVTTGEGSSRSEDIIGNVIEFQVSSRSKMRLRYV